MSPELIQLLSSQCPCALRLSVSPLGIISCSHFSGPAACWKERSCIIWFQGPLLFYPLCYPFLLALLTVSDLSWGTLPTNSVPRFALIHLLSSSHLQSRETRECDRSDTVIDSDLAVCLHQLSEKSIFGTTGQDELLLLPGFVPQEI